jgi:hypothetical protein
MIPIESAAFRRMPAFFIAAARSGPCEIARASSSAACASASKSSTGRLCVAMMKKLGRNKSRCLSGSRLSGSEGGFSTWNQEGIKSREVIWDKKFALQISRESGTGQTHKTFRVYHAALIQPSGQPCNAPRIHRSRPLGGRPRTRSARPANCLSVTPEMT